MRGECFGGVVYEAGGGGVPTWLGTACYIPEVQKDHGREAMAGYGRATPGLAATQGRSDSK